MSEVTKEQLLRAEPGTVSTASLQFRGLRGDSSKHLSRGDLENRLAQLPPAPLDEGSVQLLLARGPSGERHLPDQAVLSVAEGMPGDRWSSETQYGPEHQLATTRSDFARVIANGQPLELHGDNLFVFLDLSPQNLPIGSLLQVGEARLRVTPQQHNGCKKWVQRFGLHPMQLNLDPKYRSWRLRGIYLQVVEDGQVRTGDSVRVLRR